MNYFRTYNGRIGHYETIAGETYIVTCDGFTSGPIKDGVFSGKKHEPIGWLNLPAATYLTDAQIREALEKQSDEIGDVLVQYIQDTGWRTITPAQVKAQLAYRMGSKGGIRNPITFLKHTSLYLE